MKFQSRENEYYPLLERIIQPNRVFSESQCKYISLIDGDIGRQLLPGSVLYTHSKVCYAIGEKSGGSNTIRKKVVRETNIGFNIH